HLLFLLSNTLLSAETGLLDLLSAGLSLVAHLLQKFGSGLFCLPLVDRLHQHSLVLEAITLALHVHFKIILHVLVDFLGLSVFPEQPTKNPHAPNPEDLHRHTSLTFPFAMPHMATFTASFSIFTNACPGVHFYRFTDDQTIFYQFSDILTYMRLGN
ncbi:hypothetical protein EGW08_004730, partial [Elysia chlorotica]